MTKKDNPIPKNPITDGTVHSMPKDLREALDHDMSAREAWHTLTPLARNEWICWVISVKQQKTRDEHVIRTITELKQGVRRPCCWIGCIHRKDKAVSPSVQAIIDRRAKSSH